MARSEQRTRSTLARDSAADPLHER